MNPQLVYLTQTDTTVGFVSQNAAALAKAKKRDPRQPFLICVDTFTKQKRFSRTPKKFKKLVRRSQKTTFIYPNKKAIRVVLNTPHHKFLKAFDYMYSSSANESNKSFDLKYAVKQADIIVEDERGFYEGSASRMLKLGKSKKTKLR